MVEHPSQMCLSPQQNDPSVIHAPSPSVDILYGGLRVVDMSAVDSVSKIRSFMHSPSRVAAARDLRGKEAQGLIDLIDQVCPQLRYDCIRGTGERRRFFHCQNWMETFGNNVRTCFISSAKPPNYCQLHMFWNKSRCVSVMSTVTAGSRTSAKGSTWDVAWLSNTSGSGRRTHSTRFSRYLSYNLPVCSLLLSLHTAVLPGNYGLEAPVSPKHLAPFGSVCLHESSMFPYRL